MRFGFGDIPERFSSPILHRVVDIRLWLGYDIRARTPTPKLCPQRPNQASMSRHQPRPPARASRAYRETQRIRRVAAAAGGEANSVLAGALAQIGAAFDEAAAVNSFKIRIERLLRFAPDHPAMRARFGARAAMLAGRDLDAAVIIVERWWRDERKAFQIASALGCGTRLSLEVLRELRLILRLMRRKRMQAEYEAILVALRAAPIAVAAE